MFNLKRVDVSCVVKCLSVRLHEHLQAFAASYQVRRCLNIHGRVMCFPRSRSTEEEARMRESYERFQKEFGEIQRQHQGVMTRFVQERDRLDVELGKLRLYGLF